MRAFKRAITELSAIGRNLNQIARLAHQGAPIGARVRADFEAMLKICTALRDTTKDMLVTNERSWQAGYDVTKS